MPTATLLRICGLFAILMLLPGCRPIPHNAAVEPALLTATLTPAPTRVSGEVILPREIESAQVANAFEAINRLRPELLQRRGRPTPESPKGVLPSVFVNDVEQRELGALRTVPAGVVVEIRYLSASAAAPQFGRQHLGGVIAVRTRR